MLRSLLLLVALIATAYAASNCCVPPQMTWTSWMAGADPTKSDTNIAAYGSPRP